MQLASLLQIQGTVKGGKVGENPYNLSRAQSLRVIVTPRVPSGAAAAQRIEPLQTAPKDLGVSRKAVVMGQFLGGLLSLVAVGAVFTMLGVSELKGIEVKKEALEQARMVKCQEKSEAAFRRTCLADRETATRLDPVGMTVAVRIPAVLPSTPPPLAPAPATMVAKAGTQPAAVSSGRVAASRQPAVQRADVRQNVRTAKGPAIVPHSRG